MIPTYYVSGPSAPFRAHVTLILAFVLFGLMSESSQSQTNGKSAQLASNKTEKFASKMEYQVRVDIYTDDSKPPVNSLQTIFSNGMAIEFNDQQGRFTVVDPVGDRVSILDREKKSLVHLSMRTVESQLDRAIQLMSPEQQAAFSCDGPAILESAGRFSIGNQTIRYQFTPLSTKPEIAIGYAEFSDWVTRVYALHGPKMPPQIRMELNKLLASQSQLPGELRRIVWYGGKTEKPIREEVIARLHLTESLTESDKGRVASVYQWMKDFRPMTESDFFK
ncbi:MAG: hypothetical protein ABL921_20710 [Pirellula sp.]